MRPRTDTPCWIAVILSRPWLLPISRAALVSAFLLGGIQKLVDFNGAVSEQAHFGLQPAWLWAAAAIVVELGGSVLVIAGRCVWLGAGGLGVLTAVSMLVANNFWAQSGHDRFIATNAFFEHLGLIAGLVLVTIPFSSQAEPGITRRF
ncbi:DoxX family protein [Bradyrhizobium sp. Arg68]|uniref:DoxX family protein n=1 Tax=Bradyrhizobium ivorense TaxID=2511166 RepID=UPI001E60003C|nr:DoxX family protein [Bradyrhizobium ivorense]MCC8940311.1 DoxX family protein [Bradyrhizobium ivorense]